MILDTLNGILFSPRLHETFLMRNNYAVISILAFYIYFVKYWGPQYMKRRKAMDLKTLIRVFNMLLVLSNVYLCIKITEIAVEYFSSQCNLKQNPKFKELYETMGYRAYQVLLVKIVELLDTVLFVLRKKFQHISFLHVFHHAIVVLMCWVILKKNAIGYYLVLVGSINTGVHVIMYTYYFLAAFGPAMQKYLWWKKYLTMLQIAQFISALVYMAYTYATGCEEFGALEKTAFVTLTTICVLFLRFYVKSYTSKTNEQKEKSN